MAGLRNYGALPLLPYVCPLNFISCCCVEKGWSFTSTPLHVSTELITRLDWEWVELYLHSPTCVHWIFLSLGCVEKLCNSSSNPRHESTEILISWLGWECVELYLHSPSCVHRTFYHVAVLKFVVSLPPLRYICPLNLHVALLRMGGTLPTLPYTCPQNILSRGWVGKLCSSTSPPLHVSTELFITWLDWESLELYLHSPTWIHWTSNHVAMLRMCGAVPLLPYICPLNFLSRGWFEK